MAFSGFLFVLMRIVEFIFIVPIIGILAYFVNGFDGYDQTTPAFILVLFIVSVIAGVWILLTLVFYVLARRLAVLLAIVDLLLFGALIAGVVVLRGITDYSCSDFPRLSYIGISLGVFNYNLQNSCQELKACFALGIIEILCFFATFLLALLIWRHRRREDRDGDGVRTEKRTTRRRRYRNRDREGGSRTASRTASRSVSRDRRGDRSRSRRTRSQYSASRTYA